jgi:putative N6-adenine-specific DNA methylase
MALNIAPGIRREFAFEKLKNFDEKTWNGIRDEARSRQLPSKELPIYGCDLYGEQVDLAYDNLDAAGLENVVRLKQANVLEISPPEASGTLVSNPPYGVRIGEQQDLADFYPKLGDLLKKKFAGWNAYIFTGDLRLPKLIRLTPSKRIPLFNGPLECRLYEFKMIEGSLRRKPTGAEE